MKNQDRSIRPNTDNLVDLWVRVTLDSVLALIRDRIVIPPNQFKVAYGFNRTGLSLAECIKKFATNY